MPLTATSMTSSGVSLLVARCSTWLTPATARSTSARSAMLPRTTSSRPPGASGRLWQSARSRMWASAGSESTRWMKACPTLPAAPVTNSSMIPSLAGPASLSWRRGRLHDLAEILLDAIGMKPVERQQALGVRGISRAEAVEQQLLHRPAEMGRQHRRLHQLRGRLELEDVAAGDAILAMALLEVAAGGVEMDQDAL